MTVLLIVILIMAAFTVFSLLRTHTFQVFAGRMAAGILSDKLKTEIQLDKLRITESLYVQLNGLKIKDHHKQDLLNVNEMRVKIDWLSLKDHIFIFEKVNLDSGGFYLEQYSGDSLMNLGLFLQAFAPDSVQQEDTVPAPVWSFYCKELMINDFSFALKNEFADTLNEGMDFNHLAISDIFLDIKEISVIGDSVAAFIEHIACREKSGLELLNFSGDAKVSNTGIRLKGGQISTGQTSLDLDLDFLYDNYDQLSYFLDSVRIRSKIRSSLITLSDVGYFAPELLKMEDPVMFSGNVDGTVSNFAATDLQLSLGEITEFEGSLTMRGLPDFNSTYVSLSINRLTTTPDDIAGFELPLPDPNLEMPPQLQSLGMTSLTGCYIGYVNNFELSLDLLSNVGAVTVNGSFSDNNPEKVARFSGDFSGKSVNLGEIMGIADLGTLDFVLESEGEGSAVDNLDLEINGWIDQFEYKNHRYEKIILGGNVKGKSFDGELNISDPSLMIGFNGLVDFNDSIPVFKFGLDIEKAKLYQLNLSDRSEDMNLKGQITGDFKGLDFDEFSGKIQVKDLHYVENKQTYELNNLFLARMAKPGHLDSIKLRSDYIDGDLEGRFNIMNLVSQLNAFVLGKEQDSAYISESNANPQVVSFKFNFKDIDPVTELFLPYLEVSPGMKISGKFNSQEQHLDIEGNTDDIVVSGIKIHNLNFSGVTVLNQFNMDIGMRQIVLQEDEEGPVLGLENLLTHIVIDQDSVLYFLQWDNDLPDKPNKGTLDGFTKFNSFSDFEAGIYQAEANFNGNLWRIEKNNLFRLDSSRIEIDQFEIYKGEENFIIDGILSDSPSDTLNIYFDDWSLANFNPLLAGMSLETEGVINGRFGVFRNGEQKNFFAGINIADFSLNQVYFGDAEFKTRWLDSQKAVALDLNVFAKGSTDDPYKILGVNGLYYPFDEKRNFDFDISTQNLNISVLEPLLSSFSSHLEGFATGKLTLDGTNDKPLLLGRLKLQRAEMKVDYLNVIYSFSNEVVFTQNMIRFNDLTVYDPSSNTAKLNGGISHTNFNDMHLDLTIEPQNMLGMDLNRYQNEYFYGKAYTTGTVKLTGPFDNLAIAVDVKTEKNTKVAIPINYSVDVSNNDFIIFTNQDDTTGEDGRGEIKVTGLSLDLAFNVTKDADIEIYLPGNLGTLRAAGDGKLRMGVDPNGYLTMNGSYVIHSGLFVFSLEQLVSRRFDIMEGSRISWNGDIYDAEVGIVARYRLRTDLSGLGISMIDPEASSQKVIVFTDIRMTGNLFNPDLSFGITFPNMPDQTRQAIYAVLDTNDQGLMNQQAISLLVLGSFSSTGTGGTNPVNPAAIVSSTLSYMLSQISNDFNIGINYMPGDQVSSEQLEVALSTQLLDDRLIIDGNIDVMGSNASSQQTSSIVGDINVEYKLTPDGRFRVKAFNRSNDLTVFDDDAPYTQGVGVFYRKDFNNLKELFSRQGKSKQKKEGK